MKNSEKFKENPRRVELINLSVDMRMMKIEGMARAKSEAEMLYWASLRINDMIMLRYVEQSGTDDFRTFSGWHEAGFKIKKGERGWIIWAQKRSASVPGQKVLAPAIMTDATPSGQSDEIVAEYKFFPICYLFNNFQVEPLTPQSHETN